MTVPINGPPHASARRSTASMKVQRDIVVQSPKVQTNSHQVITSSAAIVTYTVTWSPSRRCRNKYTPPEDIHDRSGRGLDVGPNRTEYAGKRMGVTRKSFVVALMLLLTDWVVARAGTVAPRQHMIKVWFCSTDVRPAERLPSECSSPAQRRLQASPKSLSWLIVLGLCPHAGEYTCSSRWNLYLLAA